MMTNLLFFFLYSCSFILHINICKLQRHKNVLLFILLELLSFCFSHFYISVSFSYVIQEMSDDSMGEECPIFQYIVNVVSFLNWLTLEHSLKISWTYMTGDTLFNSTYLSYPYANTICFDSPYLFSKLEISQCESPNMVLS